MTSDLCICHTHRAGSGVLGDLGNHETELCTEQDQTSVFAFVYLGHRRNADSAFLESSLVLLLNHLCHRHPGLLRKENDSIQKAGVFTLDLN